MSRNRVPYSANVVLRLAMAGQVWALAQVGPDFVVLKDLPTSSEDADTARVDVIVDNRVASSRTVFLPHGIVSGRKRIIYF